MVARLTVKNRTEEPLGLSHIRLVTPRIRGEIVHEDVPFGRWTAICTAPRPIRANLIPPKMVLPQCSVMIRGVPWRKPKNEVWVKIAISDDEGYEQGHFGWHTFRHTYATLLKGNGEDVKVVQELMRHANISVTLNVYAQAITQTKRDAQSRVVSLLLDKNEEKPSTETYRTIRTYKILEGICK